MAVFDNRIVSSRRADDAAAEGEEELRVLTALIGCIMVAEDAGGRRDRRGALQHLSPPSLSRELAAPPVRHDA